MTNRIESIIIGPESVLGNYSLLKKRAALATLKEVYGLERDIRKAGQWDESAPNPLEEFLARNYSEATGRNLLPHVRDYKQRFVVAMQKELERPKDSSFMESGLGEFLRYTNENKVTPIFFGEENSTGLESYLESLRLKTDSPFVSKDVLQHAGIRNSEDAFSHILRNYTPHQDPGRSILLSDNIDDLTGAREVGAHTIAYAPKKEVRDLMSKKGFKFVVQNYRMAMIFLDSIIQARQGHSHEKQESEQSSVVA